MGNFLNEYYGDDWRDRIVTHRTPTGRITRVKVKSLPPKEQLKYNPNRFKRTKADTKMTKGDFDKLKPVDEKVRTMDVYMASRDLDVIEDIRNNVREGKLIMATTDSKNVIDLFNDELDVVKMLKVPVTAIKKYLDTDIESVESVEDLEFKDAGTEDEEKLYELSKFTDATIFLLDLYPYLNDIEIKIDKQDDDEDDFEELATESHGNFLAYYMNEDAGGLITEMPHLRIGSATYDFYMEKDGWVDRLIAIIKNKKHSIDEILEPFYGVYKRFFQGRYKMLDDYEQEKLKKYVPKEFMLAMGV